MCSVKSYNKCSKCSLSALTQAHSFIVHIHILCLLCVFVLLCVLYGPCCLK